MERTRLNKRDGIIHMIDGRGFFCYPAKGESSEGKKEWHYHYLRLMDLTLSRDSERRPVYRRRNITEFDSKKKFGANPFGSVTNHIDLLIDQIPELCATLMELYEQEKGLRPGEAAKHVKKAEEEDLDEVGLALKKLGGQVG